MSLGRGSFDLINERRAAAGCAPIAGDENLRRAAERHVVDMRDHPEIYAQPDPSKPNYRDPHIGSDGSTIDQRIAAAGYAPRLTHWRDCVRGPPGNNEQANIKWWIESPTHKVLIETCAFTHAGVGLVYPAGQWFSVVDFGAH